MMPKRGLNLWHRKHFFVPTPSVRQTLFETSEVTVVESVGTTAGETRGPGVSGSCPVVLG